MARRSKNRHAPPRSRFPARAVLLDASALIRLYKCESLELLTNTVKLAAAEHVHGEFEAGGPAQRAALGRLAVSKRSIVPGSPEWKHFVLVRKGFSTVDLGEDQSIAIALAEAERDTPMPIVCYDYGAVRKAHELNVATVSFLATLAWLISCGRLSLEHAEELEERATA